MQKYKSKDWKDWIFERFGDKEKYIIRFNEQHAAYSIRSTNKKNETTIYFEFMNNEDNEVLYDVQFSENDKEDNFRWPSPFTVDKEYKPSFLSQLKAGTRLETSLFYNEKFINRLESEWLVIPLKNGWKEELNFIGTKIYRAKLKINGGNGTDWDMNEKYTFNLNDWESIKLIFGFGKSSEIFKCESMN